MLILHQVGNIIVNLEIELLELVYLLLEDLLLIVIMEYNLMEIELLLIIGMENLYTGCRLNLNSLQVMLSMDLLDIQDLKCLIMEILMIIEYLMDVFLSQMEVYILYIIIKCFRPEILYILIQKCQEIIYMNRMEN